MDNQEQFQSINQKPKNSIWVITITILITALVVGGGIYYWQNKISNKEKQKLENRIEELESQVEQNSLQNQTSELESLDETWDLYTNYKLGFSIKITKESWNQKLDSPIEDENIVYMLAYEKDKNIEGVSNSSPDIDKVKGKSWAILIKEAKSEEDLNNIIKERFCSYYDCTIKEKREYEQQEGVFLITIDQSGPGYPYYILYYPKLDKVALWSFSGHEPLLYNNITKEDFTFEAMNSFRFIE